MPKLADIFRLYGQKYRAQFGSRMLPSHLKAMYDIEHCRPEALGGQWLPSSKRFFVHVKPLSRPFRAKFRHELKKNQLTDFVLPKVWEKDW